MIADDFLRMLRCPHGQGPLANADAGLLARLNAAVARGILKNRSGSPITEPLDGGLVDEAGTRLYPVHNGIPNLLVDEAIPLDQLGADSPDD